MLTLVTVVTVMTLVTGSLSGTDNWTLWSEYEDDIETTTNEPDFTAIEQPWVNVESADARLPPALPAGSLDLAAGVGELDRPAKIELVTSNNGDLAHDDSDGYDPWVEVNSTVVGLIPTLSLSPELPPIWSENELGLAVTNMYSIVSQSSHDSDLVPTVSYATSDTTTEMVVQYPEPTHNKERSTTVVADIWPMSDSDMVSKYVVDLSLATTRLNEQCNCTTNGDGYIQTSEVRSNSSRSLLGLNVLQTLVLAAAVLGK